jgi:hypothetical protein
MSSVSRKIREYGQLSLLLVGFLSGIAVVVTCGGGGGGDQGASSTASTISFVPINLGVVQFDANNDGSFTGHPLDVDTDVSIPPALNGVTNVQDALNRLNAILSPELSRLSDPARGPGTVPDSLLPQIIFGSDGEPLTFSRRLRGLVRASNLSGPLRADNLFLLSCEELPEDGDPLLQPFVSRLFCDEGNVNDTSAIFEIFRATTPGQDPGVTTGSAISSNIIRFRLDGVNNRLTVHDDAGNPTITLDGLTGGVSITSITATGSVVATGNVQAGQNLIAGQNVNAGLAVNAGTTVTAAGNVTSTGGDVVSSTGNVSAGNDVNAANDVNAGNLVTGGTGVIATGGDVAAQAGNVTASGNVTAAGGVVGGTGVTATTGDVAAQAGNLTASGDVIAGGNVSGTNVNAAANVNGNAVNATSTVTAGGDITSTGGNLVANAGGVSAGTVVAGTTITAGGDIISNAGNVAALTGNVSAGGNVLAGANVNANGAVTAGSTITAAGDITSTAGGIVAGAVAATPGSITALNDVTATNGNVLAPNGVVRAGADPLTPTFGNGALLSSLGLLSLNSTAAAATLIGNAQPMSSILEIRDFSSTPTGSAILVDAGEKLGAATDSNGFLRVRSATGTTDITLDGETGTVTANALSIPNATFDNLTINVSLTSTGTSALNGGATVTGGLATDTITTSGLATLAAGAAVTGGLATDTLTASGLATLSGGATVTGGLAADTVTASGIATFNGGVSATTLAATGLATLSGGATVTGGLTTDTIMASGAATFAGATNVSGGLTTTSITASGLASFNGPATFANTVNFNAAVTSAAQIIVTSGGIAVTGGTTTDTLTASGLANLNGGVATTALTASGAVSADSLTANGAAGVTSTTLTVSGNSMLAGVTASSLTATGTVSADTIAAGVGGVNTTTLNASGNTTLAAVSAATLTTAGAVNAASLTSATSVNAGSVVAAATDVTAGQNVIATASVTVAGVATLSSDINGGTIAVMDNSTATVFSVTSPAGAGDGVVTVGSATTGTNIVLDGVTSSVNALTANATVKAFIQPHPTDAGLEIVYHCLEGPENGLYARGRGQLVNGIAHVALPESFTLAAAEQSLTVQLTPMDECMGLSIVKSTLTRQGFTVRELMNGASNAEFSWFANGVRRGLEQHQDIRPTEFYKPRVSDASFASQIPGVQQLLIANGTLNADGTPNQTTARRLGWQMKTQAEIRTASEPKTH